MIYQNFTEILKKLGAEAFGEKGEQFDPNFHNGVMHIEDDSFGENVVVRPADCGHFIATVEVSANPPFYAWVFTFGGKIKILSPKSVVDEFKTQLKETLNNQ